MKRATTHRTSAPAITLLVMSAFAVTAAHAQVTVEEDDDGDRRTIIFDEEAGPGGVNWTRKYCDDKEECKIQIDVIDGKRTVIVNGDTVQSLDLLDDRAFLHPHRPRFGNFTADNFFWQDDDGPGFSVFAGDLDELALLDSPSFRIGPGPGLEWLSDETLRDLEHEARDLAREIRSAKGSDKSDLEAKLDAKLAEIFDYKNTRREKDIAAAEKHVKELRDRQQQRLESRDEIIENRKQELLGEESYLEW